MKLYWSDYTIHQATESQSRELVLVQYGIFLGTPYAGCRNFLDGARVKEGTTLEGIVFGGDFAKDRS